MKIRLLSIGLVALAAGLAACGGNGGGTTTPPTPAPIPTGTPVPGYFNQRPANPGDAFAFAGMMTATNVYNYPATPLPTTTVSSIIAQAITVTAALNPFVSQTATDFNTVETDTQNLRTLTTTSDGFYGFAPAGSGFNFVLYGLTTTDSGGSSYKYAYGTTPLIIDELPQAAGSFTNTAAVTITEKDADGTNAVRTYNPDGTYTETQNQPLGSSATVIESPDGSGSYLGNGFFNGQIAGLTFSAPVGGKISAAIVFPLPPTPTPNPTGSPAPTPNPTTPPQVITVNQWYPATPKFYNEADVATTAVTFPASCNVPASYGTSGNQLTQTIDRLDTVFGFTDHMVTTSYLVAGFGPVCVSMSDLQTSYYDYLGDQNFTYVFSSQPQSTSTILENLTLQAGATIKSRARKDAAGSPIPSSMIVAGRARFLTAIADERRSRERAFEHYLKQRLAHLKGAAGR
ncbi:MAG: hypothetical protein ABI182_01075 [Candidatus Baltobacteraceae bacterium]